MNAMTLLNKEIIPVKTSDTGAMALEMMADYGVRHLPIVNDIELLGLVSEEDILNEYDQAPIGSYSISLIQSAVPSTLHIFEIIKFISKMRLTLVPVVDENNVFLGVITHESILDHLGNSLSISENGSIIVLKMQKFDYSMAEIARIIESEDYTILNTFLHHDYDTQKIYVSIKVNKEGIGALISAFNRFDIEVSSVFTKSESPDSLKDRYDSLMQFLSV